MRRIPLRVYIIAYVVLIAVLSLMPGNDIPDVDLPDIDKLVHLLMYAGLGYLSASAFSTCPLKWRQVRFWLFIMGFTHLQASCVLFALNILVIVVAFTFQNVGILWLGLIEFAILLLFASILDLSVKRKKKAGEPINYCDV